MFDLRSGKVRPQCKPALPLTEFHRDRRRVDALAFYCKACATARSEESRRRRGIAPQKRSPVPVAEGLKETRQRLHGGSREYHLRRRYGVGQKEFDELLAEQGGVCAICGGADPQHLDHDHRTGWVRGILCFNCNGGLGQFRDSPTRLARAITYLRGTTWQRALIHPGVYQMCSPTRGRPPSPRS
ncbi:Recombination endonuclease VII [Micromonospora purpureochromogenes]|uniref:Recombination endonuclease VII n=1 Tax=Micromonospora purpureochromogenes TaxID=47872 RepID=A0A1C4YWF8_9ACTN|nr:endonuclease VII domain-containing protein [Micromonospora purpureochromogenes]SCF25014.1 Recombination endonuclease VII [Micromonospora purpureochromogenes]